MCYLFCVVKILLIILNSNSVLTDCAPALGVITTDCYEVPVMIFKIETVENDGLIVNITCLKKDKSKKGLLQLIELCTGTGEVYIRCQSKDYFCNNIFKKEKKEPQTKYFCRIYYDVTGPGTGISSYEVELLGDPNILYDGTTCNRKIEISLNSDTDDVHEAHTENNDVHDATDSINLLPNEIDLDNPNKPISKESKLSISSIIGIVIAVLVIIVLFVGGILYIKRKLKISSNKQLNEEEEPAYATAVQYVHLDLSESNTRVPVSSEPPYAQIIGVLTKKK